MVCVEEICSIFKNLQPHKRIELMCGLLQCCLPLELRFIGSYVENLGRRDFNYLREHELKANSCPEINKLFKSSEDVIRRNLAVYLSLLHTSNSACAKLCFELLIPLNEYLIRTFDHASPLTFTKLSVDVMLELLTVLVMGINHPAFTFDQRTCLYEIYRRLESQAQRMLPLAIQKVTPPPDRASIQVHQSSVPMVPTHESLYENEDPVPQPMEPRYNPGVIVTHMTHHAAMPNTDHPHIEPLVNSCYRSPHEPGLHCPHVLHTPSEPHLSPHVIHSSNEPHLSPHILHSPPDPHLSPVLTGVIPPDADLWPSVQVGLSPSQIDRSFLEDFHQQKVFIKKVEVKGSRKIDRKQEFQMEVTWSNGETSEVYKSYQELYDFHTKLVQLYPEDASGHRQDRKLPFLSGTPHLSARDDSIEQTSHTVTEYFRKLVSLQNDILGCDHVIQFFHQSSSPLSPPSPNRSTTSHISSPNSLSLGETNVTNSRDHNSTIISSKPSPPRTIIDPVTSPTRPNKPRPASPSPSPTHTLPSMQQLLDDLQLSHHWETFSKFTTNQLLEFTEEDFKIFKLSHQAMKRLNIKLRQLQSKGRLLNGINKGIEHVYISSGEGSESDYSPPKMKGARERSPRQNQNVEDCQFDTTDKTSCDFHSNNQMDPADNLDIPLGRGEIYNPVFELSQNNITDSAGPQNHIDEISSDLMTYQHDTQQWPSLLSPDSVQLPPNTLYTSTARIGRLSSSDHGNSSRDSSPPLSPNQSEATRSAGHSHDTHQDEMSSPIHASSHPTTNTPQSNPEMTSPIHASSHPTTNTPQSNPEMTSHPDMGANPGISSFQSFHGSPALPPTHQIVEINTTGPDVSAQILHPSSQPLLPLPTEDKPPEQPPVYPPGFVPEPAVTNPYPQRPSYARVFHHMYPICAPQPAHLPVHMYHKVPMSPEQLHCKMQSLKLYPPNPTDAPNISNNVMTVTVNSSVYNSPVGDNSGHHSPSLVAAAPVTSTANFSRTMTLPNPTATHFALPSTIPSPLTFSNMTPVALTQTHRKLPNGPSSNAEGTLLPPPVPKVENVNYVSPQHIASSVAPTPPYSPSSVHTVPVISVQSSCTSCGCRGRCGGSPNMSAAYGGYVHHQVNMPHVVHVPTFMPSNSNGLLPNPLPTNCHMTFHANPIPNVPNGITPEQMSIHSYSSYAASHPLWNPPGRDKTRPPTCYNCGKAGHEGRECKESTMDSASGQYTLSYNPDLD